MRRWSRRVWALCLGLSLGEMYRCLYFCKRVLIPCLWPCDLHWLLWDKRMYPAHINRIYSVCSFVSYYLYLFSVRLIPVTACINCPFSHWRIFFHCRNMFQFGAKWIPLLKTFLYMSFDGHMYSYHLGINTGVRLLSNRQHTCSALLVPEKTVFWRVCSIL